MALLFAVVISAQAGITSGGDEPLREDPGGVVYLPVVQVVEDGIGFYLSPTGDDNFNGTSPGQAWATFEHAWTVLKPGDTLTMLDGVYYQSMVPNISGQPGKPITVRAQNDGQAIIDGQGVRIPVHMRYESVDYHFVIEGIIARNSSRSVLVVSGNHNVLRRVSGYNANTDENSHVFSITGAHNLVEDCVASGTGRKMVLVFEGEYNTIRRCFTDWREWDGRNWGTCWPWGEGLEFYGASHNIIENSIAYSRTARVGVYIISQSARQQAIGNKILGTMSVLAGMKEDGSTPMVWGDTRPQPSDYTCMSDIYGWPQYMSGFGIYASGSSIRENLLQDILSWGNARYGLSFITAADYDLGNNHINRATIFNNGLNNPNAHWGGMGAGAKESELANFTSITNSSIENIYDGSTFTSQSGEGARLTHRYVDGVLTNEPLWPWPMEERIQAELGYSVTEIMTDIISQSP